MLSAMSNSATYGGNATSEEGAFGEALNALLPPLPDDAHKYTRGSLLVLAGSRRFPGAAVLAARAAARAGAGYVTLAIPEPAATVAQTHLLSVPVIAAPAIDGAFAADAWESIRTQVTHLDAIVLGPGLTVTPSTSLFVQVVLQEAHDAQRELPVLLDADALNILSAFVRQGWQGFHPEASTEASTEVSTEESTETPDMTFVLTPHAGELKRLCEATGTFSTLQLAKMLQAIVVAKGPQTHIVSSAREYCSTSGTSALAKAGTGDVLAGIIGSFIAQGATPFDAAVLGVEVHGRAGQLAENALGRRAVCAEDVIEAIPAVLQRIERRQ
ncbi:MAG: NAD(P)H-hydrate dehydratase [Coriobacteriales bacterium]|jgi:NAD(P)H-hydrate epimerase|nr:NAD(P)H-hydrate dehydratase [Coriobacteriales bacterium]